jgi:benzoyl-CoA reductase/2-hydroxyglutaryl-CoA dehydratase subunit BcrC/BadD/HgdB
VTPLGQHGETGDADESLESQVAYVIQNRREHAYSPAVTRLLDLSLSYVDDAEAAARKGSGAAWVMGLWDAPLFYACDTIPVSLTELGRLGSAEANAVAEDHFQFPKETCSMVATLLGEWYMRSASSIKRIVMYNGYCEPLNQAGELIRREGYQLHRIDSVVCPADSDNEERRQQMVRFLTGQLGGTARWLTGKPVDDVRLAHEIRRANRLLRKIRRMLDLRVHNPYYIRSLATMFILMGIGHYFGKPDAYEDMLDLLIEELQTAAVVPAPRGRIVPLAWVGARGQEFGVYKAVDDSGGAILGWYTANPWLADWREDLPPLEAVADYWVNRTARTSWDRRLAGIEQVVERSGARGLLMYMYVGCSFGGIHHEIQRTHFQEKGVPSMSLEGSFQVGPPTGQLLTRVRAFVEMLT